MSVDKKSSYYDAGGIEVMEVIRAKLSPEQFRGFLHGNILKYSSRMNFKGSYDRDLEKVGVYQGLLSELSSPVTSIVVPEDFTIPPEYHCYGCGNDYASSTIHTCSPQFTEDSVSEKEDAEYLAKECARLGCENVGLVLSNQRLTCEVSDQAVTISDLQHTIDLQMEHIKSLTSEAVSNNPDLVEALHETVSGQVVRIRCFEHDNGIYKKRIKELSEENERLNGENRR